MRFVRPLTWFAAVILCAARSYCADATDINLPRLVIDVTAQISEPDQQIKVCNNLTRAFTKNALVWNLRPFASVQCKGPSTPRKKQPSTPANTTPDDWLLKVAQHENDDQLHADLIYQPSGRSPLNAVPVLGSPTMSFQNAQ